jgi:hypothetical protein
MLRALVLGLVVNFATIAAAGHFDGGGALRGNLGSRIGDFLGAHHGLRLGGGFGLGGDLGFGFGHGHGIGLGLAFGFFDAERTQERFETRFDDLMTDYEDGVANIPDFFTTDDYTDIVDDTERLSFKYELFVGGVERNIDRLGSVIDFANDELTYFNDLLADFQANENISPERLEKIETWITRITDGIDTKIDRLTEKQTTLETNLPTYVSFQTDIDTFLDDIVAAGETPDPPLVATSLVAASFVAPEPTIESTPDVALPVFASNAMDCDEPLAAAVSASVPEPTALLPLGLAFAIAGLRRGRRASRLAA